MGLNNLTIGYFHSPLRMNKQCSKEKYHLLDHQLNPEKKKRIERFNTEYTRRIVEYFL